MRATLTPPLGARRYWLPPKTHFELRCRIAKTSEWKIERTQATNKLLTDLLPDEDYEVQVRAKNVAGWSDFSELVVIRTPAGKDGKGADYEVSESVGGGGRGREGVKITTNPKYLPPPAPGTTTQRSKRGR